MRDVSVEACMLMLRVEAHTVAVLGSLDNDGEASRKISEAVRLIHHFWGCKDIDRVRSWLLII